MASSKPTAAEDSLFGSILVVEDEGVLGSILVVEDDTEFAQLLEAGLTDCGYLVVVANDGLEAIRLLKSRRFDLVVSDLNMPRANGLDLLESIRDDAVGANVLILSGEGSIAKAVAAMKLGAVSYLEKPLNLESLKHEVRSAIRASRDRVPSPSTLLIRPPAHPQVAQIARYRVVGSLGSGGMGTVYRCFDPELDRPVALKVVSLGDLRQLKQKEVRERFSREARALGRLRHPRIVTVHDFGEDADRGLLYLAMDLIEGRSLHDLQKGPERIGWRFVVAIAHQVADALEYAHRRGIVHRDVKPANIVIGEHDRATLVDFGIAKLEASSLTQAGMVLGTPSYLAPEMLSNQGSDYRADQFSLGTVLIEALAGRKIFAGDSFESVAAQIMIRETPSFAELGIDAPPTLEGIVRRLHQKDPSARYQDELELIDDLTIVALDAGLDLHRAETHS